MFSKGDRIGDRESDIAARVTERVVGSVSSEGGILARVRVWVTGGMT